jgi:hypothetical protein
VPDEPEDITQLAMEASRAYAEHRTAERFLDDRDWTLCHLIRAGDVEVADDGMSATFSREFVDAVWRNRRSVQYAKGSPDEPYPGSVEEFVENYFKGGMPGWPRALTKRGRAQRQAWKALRDEWRQTGRMQLGSTLAGILRRSGRFQ